MRLLSKRESQNWRQKPNFPLKSFTHKFETALSLPVYISLELGFSLCWFYYLAISSEIYSSSPCTRSGLKKTKSARGGNSFVFRGWVLLHPTQKDLECSKPVHSGTSTYSKPMWLKLCSVQIKSTPRNCVGRSIKTLCLWVTLSVGLYILWSFRSSEDFVWHTVVLWNS